MSNSSLMNRNDTEIDTSKMLCICSPTLAAHPVVIPLQHKAKVYACPSKPGHRQPLSDNLPKNGFLSPNLIDLTLANCWDQGVGRQYSVISA